MPPLTQRVASPNFAPLFHLMQQRGRDPHAGATDWMAQSDRAAIYVQSIGVEIKFAVAGNHLRRKSFVELDQIDLHPATNSAGPTTIGSPALDQSP